MRCCFTLVMLHDCTIHQYHSGLGRTHNGVIFWRSKIRIYARYILENPQSFIWPQNPLYMGFRAHRAHICQNPNGNMHSVLFHCIRIHYTISLVTSQRHKLLFIYYYQHMLCIPKAYLRTQSAHTLSSCATYFKVHDTYSEVTLL